MYVELKKLIKYVETTAVNIELSKFRKLCIEYLTDAGFTVDMLQIEENYQTNSLNITFDNEEAIKYIIKDIKKTKFKNRIKVYKKINQAIFYKL